MKRFILLVIVLIGTATTAMSQAKYEIRDGEMKVVAQQSSKTSSQTTIIPWTFVDKEGKEFPIYMSEKGSCFVYKSKKDGTLYKYYLGKETSKEICRKLGVTYKGS